METPGRPIPSKNRAAARLVKKKENPILLASGLTRVLNSEPQSQVISWEEKARAMGKAKPTLLCPSCLSRCSLVGYRSRCVAGSCSLSEPLTCPKKIVENVIMGKMVNK